MKTSFFILVLILFPLAGCKPVQPGENTGISDEELTWDKYIDEDIGFSFRIPPGLHKFKGLDNRPVFDTRLGNRLLTPADYSIDVYVAETTSHCSNIGVSKPEIIETNSVYTLKGLVDGYAGDYDPPATPSCFGRGTSLDLETPISYMLCSSKGDIQVAICIFQETDNPKLVDQIFSTFKWLNEK